MESRPPLDIVYLFRHSPHGDAEIRYSLRSVAKCLPFVRKVWVLGDRPGFLADDRAIVEHVPHEYIAPLLGLKTPVRNELLLLTLAALLPEVALDFLKFADDYVLLQPLTREQVGRPRSIGDLSRPTTRGSGKWKEQLWRTFDLLRQYGYTGYNFEAHVPQPCNKRLVFEAYMAFRAFTSQKRYEGVVAATTVFNYGIKHLGLDVVWVKEEQSRIGFYGKCPTTPEIAAACEGKLFLNFDDGGFGEGMQRFLEGMLPERCKYEG